MQVLLICFRQEITSTSWVFLLYSWSTCQFLAHTSESTRSCFTTTGSILESCLVSATAGSNVSLKVSLPGCHNTRAGSSMRSTQAIASESVLVCLGVTTAVCWSFLSSTASSSPFILWLEKGREGKRREGKGREKVDGRIKLEHWMVREAEAGTSLGKGKAALGMQCNLRHQEVWNQPCPTQHCTLD